MAAYLACHHTCEKCCTKQEPCWSTNRYYKSHNFLQPNQASALFPTLVFKVIQRGIRCLLPLLEARDSLMKLILCISITIVPCKLVTIVHLLIQNKAFSSDHTVNYHKPQRPCSLSGSGPSTSRQHAILAYGVMVSPRRAHGVAVRQSLREPPPRHHFLLFDS